MMTDRTITTVNRRNVKGSGPERDLLPLARHLGDVPQEVIDACLREINEKGLDQVNHCGSDSYPISVTSPLMKLFSMEYKQTLLQTPETDGLEERDYTRDNSPIMEVIKKHWPNLRTFRARLAKLPPGEVIDWHIDTNTSVYCRLQLAIQGSCTWYIKGRNGVETFEIPQGGIWFFNTGFSHRVENHSDQDRWVIILNCDYAEIEETFGDIKL